jgi:hypothetical protein
MTGAPSGIVYAISDAFFVCFFSARFFAFFACQMET